MHRGFNEGGRLSTPHGLACYQRDRVFTHNRIFPWLLLLIQYIGKCVSCVCYLSKLFINCVFPMIHFIVMIYIQGLFYQTIGFSRKDVASLISICPRLADWRPSRQCLRSKWLCAPPTPYLHPACVYTQLNFAEPDSFVTGIVMYLLGLQRSNVHKPCCYITAH